MPRKLLVPELAVTSTTSPGCVTEPSRGFKGSGFPAKSLSQRKGAISCRLNATLNSPTQQRNGKCFSFFLVELLEPMYSYA